MSGKRVRVVVRSRPTANFSHDIIKLDECNKVSCFCTNQHSCSGVLNFILIFVELHLQPRNTSWVCTQTIISTIGIYVTRSGKSYISLQNQALSLSLLLQLCTFRITS